MKITLDLDEYELHELIKTLEYYKRLADAKADIDIAMGIDDNEQDYLYDIIIILNDVINQLQKEWKR